MADQRAGGEAGGGGPTRWAQVPPAPPASGPGRSVRLVAPFLLGGVLWLLGLPTLALVVVVLGTAVGVLGLVWPPFAAVVERLMLAVSRVVGQVLSVVLLGALGLALAPIGVVLRAVGRDPLDQVGPPGRWVPNHGAAAPLPSRPYAVERPPEGRPSRPVWRLVQIVVTSVVVVVLLDVGLGWSWDHTVGHPSGAEGSAGAPVRFEDTSARADLPAMADEPWAEDYFYELDTMPSRFDPFLVNLALQYEGTYFTVDDRGRASYQPTDLPADAPVVWFFGGSTTFGEGQRDAHTIPSEVSRLAEEAGLPIRVQNYGQRGWVVWQELLRFEQELAVRDAPDLAVFYDGTNDVNVQQESGAGQPTVYNAEVYSDQIERLSADGGAQGPSLERQLYDRWRENSLLVEVASEARSVLGALPAAAGEGALTLEEEQAAVADAVAVYQRARTVILELADDHGVLTSMFWQPEAATSSNPQHPRALAAEQAGAPTVDLTDALDGVETDEVYIDGGHTNELGARLVAEAMWVHLEPQLRALVVSETGEPGR